MNNYDYDERDIAKSLKKAMSNNADIEVVKYLNDARERKIANGGAETAKYADDELSAAAKSYIDSFSKKSSEKIYEAQRKAQAQSLKNAFTEAKRSFESGKNQIETTAAEAKRLYLADSARKKLDLEDSMARLGLSKGEGKKASSGFSESARAMLLSGAAEGLERIYSDEENAKSKLAENIYGKAAEAAERYDKNINESYLNQAASEVSLENNYMNARSDKIAESNRVYENQRDFKAEQERSNRDFEYAKYKDERDFDYKRENTKFENAMKAFETAGEITTQETADALKLPIGTKTADMIKAVRDYEIENRRIDVQNSNEEFERAYIMFADTGEVMTLRQAEILGVPVGTKYWKYVTDVIRANAAATSAGASVMSARAANTNAAANMQRVAIDQQNADTSKYNSITNRFDTLADYIDKKHDRDREDSMYDY